ncbi:unnamed protein product [Leptosia nina]|uniref:E3 SUMO-protein ligase RanBP2 n=1 Tax=Leptosia nina TaxID=320188 RepID=A0AAV1JGG9_9NEOP
MYKNKKDVDKHVEKLFSKLSSKDFNARAYSIARLYYEVGDYANCQKYLEQYLTHKANNAAAHKLLGQTFHKTGLKEKALDEFKISLELDPAQTNIILDICELLADNEVTLEPSSAKYWSDKAEFSFPKHPITFKLRERLLATTNPNPGALVQLLKSELSARPKDVVLHIRLLKHYLSTSNTKEALEHSCNIEFGQSQFTNNLAWYETVSDVLKCTLNKINDWLYQLLLLTVKERLCTLSLTEIPQGSSLSLLETNDLLQSYDEAIVLVTKTGPTSGYAEFHANLLRHHRGQLTVLVATFVLKKAKRDQLNWYDANKLYSMLMLVSWQVAPIDPNADWLNGAPEKQKVAAFQWYVEGSYRCSQAGHMILGNNQDKNQLLLDNISQLCCGTNWKEKLYDNIFVNINKVAKANSYFTSNFFQSPILRLPRKIEVQAYDNDAQKLYPNSLHHFVWILLNYKNLPDFKCTIFDILTPTETSCGPETLNKLDILAFLYCATLTAQQQKVKCTYIPIERPCLLPANITDLLCTLPQIKWWDCAYKFTHNELGTEYTDIRSTLSWGIEVVRCVDNHGLDPELLCILGRLFNDLSKLTTIDDKNLLETRAYLYYESAIPLLEKLKRKATMKLPAKRLFDYTHKDLDNRELNCLLQESKLFIALKHYNNGEYIKAIECLTDVKSAESFYYLSVSYNKIANKERHSFKSSDTNANYISLLGKSKYYAYKALELLKEENSYKSLPLYSNVQDIIEKVEINISKVDSNVSISILNDGDSKYSSDENVSESDNIPSRSTAQFSYNISSTPKTKQALKQVPNMNLTNYRTALDSQVFNTTTQLDHQSLNMIEEQIRNLQKRDATIEEFKEQTRNWFDENRKLGNQIINTIHSNIENTTEQFKLLKVSVDQVKDQVAECRKECKDVADLKKQIAELKKEVNKLKKSSSEQTIDESELYNLDEDYKGNENATFGTQMPFAPPQVMAPFTQRLVPPFPVPPNPYHLYGQNLCNLYNQYSQLTQNTPIPGTSTLFDPTRAQVNYPGIYQTPDQMYLDIAHLVPPTVPPSVALPTVPNVPMVSIAPTTIASSSAVNTSKPVTSSLKPASQALPVNVVITSSDPLPTCTNTPAPTLSVTIPQKHIKGSPHNYQIPMPTSTDAKSASPLVFNLSSGNKISTSSGQVTSWNKPLQQFSENANFLNVNDSKTVVDGPFSTSPNTSLNKSRTLSERSNTSVENYDPCPDFKPIVPLPAEVTLTTGEENESVIFSARAKLFRFTDKQWKERGIGEMKLLKHNITKKVRVLMRREQVHKICANHIIIPEIEIKPMKNEEKAYFWVANDFAEEKLQLEKFCIRFKTADIAKEFFDTFEKARLESNVIDDIPTEKNKTTNTFNSSITKNKVEQTQTGKTTIGGFTFSTTPSFKVVPEVSKPQTEKIEISSSKSNIFSGLTFKTSTTSSFSNLVSSISSKNSENYEEIGASKINTSDNIEEFEPTVEFKPVVPLPALVDQKTGEEDELVLFEHRAKLLRFDVQSKEWKERGLGNIKLLVNKQNNQKVRLLMRREQIMKVCCNHAITKEINFVKMPNMDKAVTWCAKDFSEGELVTETFCLRFKTVPTCNAFIDAVKNAQSKIGSWYCTECYTNNLESFNKCACCEQPKPVEKGQVTTNSSAKSQVSWGDQFKPKPGTWECKQCLIRNQADSEQCNACNSPRDSNRILSNKENTSNLNFGIVTKPKEAVVSNWGDQFKPKEGSWECKQCFVRNQKDKEVCPACNSPKDPNAGKNAMLSTTPVSTPKFTFGIPQKPVGGNAAPTLSSLIVNPVSSLNTNSPQTFKFGITQNKETPVKTLGDNATSISLFSSQKANDSDVPINFSIKNNNDAKIDKPALLPTPDTSGLTFGSKEGGKFNFALKPKSPGKGKSPIKSPKSVKGDESGDDEYVSDDDGANIHFSPVIPMPEKVDVVTGEENEEELYGHRAKLFIFNNSEWKERGLGVIKILKHKESGRLRVLMRREQVHKICLNHNLSQDVLYKPKDEKTWYFAANDYSEGELQLQQFCIRFQNKDIATQFKNVIDKAIEAKYDTNSDKDKEDDVVFVTEIQASDEDKKRAKELMLPENFFTYTKKQPCEGCRGCEYDTDDISQHSTSKETFFKTTTTPSKTFASYLQNNTISMYGTPTSSDKTMDTTIFATPLGCNFTKESESANSSNNDRSLQTSVTRPKSSILAAPKLNKLLTSSEPPTSTPKSIFGSSETKGVFESSGDKKLFGSVNLFGSVGTTANEKNVFGISSNKSIFGNPMQSNDSQKSEVTSIFSGDSQKPVNLFSGSNPGSIFGPKLSSSDPLTSGIFSQTTTTFKFGNDDKNSKKEEDSNNSNKYSFNLATQNATPVNLEVKNSDISKGSNSNFSENPLKISDNCLSFAAVSSKTSEFGIQKKSTDFKWEGAGQQLFNASNSAEKSTEKSSEAGAVDEEYDPHYEPIVPLPEKIIVTTGEEDEEKIFGERCKLYRFDENSREWKERGVGEMKILYHPERKTYRLLLRREQIHKAVLNMLVFMDLELLPMTNSTNAWTWAGPNYADSAGEQETLAVRFKSADLARNFKDKVLECVRKLQVAAAEAIRKEKEEKEQKVESVAPLRLPKHLEDSARADKQISNDSNQSPSSQSGGKQNGGVSQSTDSGLKQVHFEEQEENYDESEHYDYDEHGDYDGYYNEEEEDESAVFYACDGEVVIEQDGTQSSREEAHVQVLFDNDVCSPKILVTDNNTGEILAEMLIHTDTVFQMSGDSCTWSGTDYTSNSPVNKTVTVYFPDNETTMEFYDSCETSKASTYESNDQEP